MTAQHFNLNVNQECIIQLKNTRFKICYDDVLNIISIIPDGKTCFVSLINPTQKPSLSTFMNIISLSIGEEQNNRNVGP